MKPKTADIWGVIVTYGNRFPLVERAAQSTLKAGVGKVVVVDNGSPPENATQLAAFCQRETHCHLVRLEENLGSAGGYARGIEEAYRNGAEFIWLLDDDNCPEPDALEQILRAYAYLGNDPAHLILALRESQVGMVKAYQYGNVPVIQPGSFLGFDLLTKVRKAFRRLFGHRSAPPQSFPLLRIQAAPYGGLFLHRSWVERVGLPNPEFVVYEDDTEYTLRILQAGGRIYLAGCARVSDLESQWHRRGAFSWASPDSREDLVYYRARNLVSLERSIANPSLRYWTNAFLYLGWLSLVALYTHRNPARAWRRLRLFLRAVQDGWKGHLGKTLPLDPGGRR
ncbi:MAG: glycosyltransferase [Thermus sp.]|uniref:glycosyltransferase n=1 Tax=Thermus TaxID=270 RepID=UPI001FA98B20|nr:glycosyltransferase [Thermus thalpophilus]